MPKVNINIKIAMGFGCSESCCRVIGWYKDFCCDRQRQLNYGAIFGMVLMKFRLHKYILQQKAGI
jgi:hypothetical protein